MDIDLQVLRLLEREKEIPFDELVLIIEAAILAAFHKHVGEQPKGARAELDRKTGHVRVFQALLNEEEEPVGLALADYSFVNDDLDHTVTEMLSLIERLRVLAGR